MSELKVNNQIRANQVVLIGSDGEKMGKKSLFEAQRLAENQNLDLILVSEKDMPVCKIADYGKIKYEKSKKQKNQTNKSSLKEIRIGMNISEHDLDIKNKKVHSLLDKGHKVKYVLMLKGNTRNFTKERTTEFFNNATEEFKESFSMTPPVFSGNQVVSTISSK